MSTVAELITRVKRDWLEPGDDQPLRCILDGTITSGATSLTVDTTLLLPEEQDLFGAGSLLEIDSEEILVGAFDESSNVASSLQRGVNGTTAASHTDGAFITVAPTWRRKVIFDAICDTVVNLWPDLYRVEQSTSLTLSSTSYTEVPAAVQVPMKLWARPTGSTSNLWQEIKPRFMDEFPPSSTGKAIDPGFNGSGYLVYKAKFDRPTSESVDLVTTTELRQEWERLVVVETVAYLVGGRELDQITQDNLVKKLEQEGLPVGSASRIQAAVLGYARTLRDQAKDALRAEKKITVTTRSPFAG